MFYVGESLVVFCDDVVKYDVVCGVVFVGKRFSVFFAPGKMGVLCVCDIILCDVPGGIARAEKRRNFFRDVLRLFLVRANFIVRGEAVLLAETENLGVAGMGLDAFCSRIDELLVECANVQLRCTCKRKPENAEAKCELVEFANKVHADFPFYLDSCLLMQCRLPPSSMTVRQSMPMTNLSG